MTNLQKRLAALALLGLMTLGMSACSQKLPDSTKADASQNGVLAQIA